MADDLTRDLALLNNRLDAIVESSDDAIVSKTLDGVIVTWNTGAERVFGYTSDEAVGQPILILIPNERKEEEDVILEKIRNGERIEHYETKLSDAEFGAFFYNTTDDSGGAYLLYTLSGAPREAFEKFGQPRATPLFGPTFRGRSRFVAATS
jgi:PAS domain S-box-containing protein